MIMLKRVLYLLLLSGLYSLVHGTSIEIGGNINTDTTGFGNRIVPTAVGPDSDLVGTAYCQL